MSRSFLAAMQRRAELVDKKSLTPEEKKELEKLQILFGKYQDKKWPLPK